MHCQWRVRWTSGQRHAMGSSSAYPNAFGEAVRFCHETYKRFGNMGPDCMTALQGFAAQMVRDLPAPGTISLPDRVSCLKEMFGVQKMFPSTLRFGLFLSFSSLVGGLCSCSSAIRPRSWMAWILGGGESAAVFQFIWRNPILPSTPHCSSDVAGIWVCSGLTKKFFCSQLPGRPMGIGPMALVPMALPGRNSKD